MDLTDLSIFEPSDLSARHAQVHNLPFVVYENDDYQKQSEYELLAVFKSALETHQTYLVYQPKIDLSNKKIVGLEALFRWQHPVKGFIAPDKFMPVIEGTKLIHTLTDWVLEQTLMQLKTLRDMGYSIPISINVSARNIYDQNFSIVSWIS